MSTDVFFKEASTSRENGGRVWELKGLRIFYHIIFYLSNFGMIWSTPRTSPTIRHMDFTMGWTCCFSSSKDSSHTSTAGVPWAKEVRKSLLGNQWKQQLQGFHRKGSKGLLPGPPPAPRRGKTKLQKELNSNSEENFGHCMATRGPGCPHEKNGALKKQYWMQSVPGPRRPGRRSTRDIRDSDLISLHFHSVLLLHCSCSSPARDFSTLHLLQFSSFPYSFHIYKRAL